MAKQESFIKLKGTIGDLSFYKDRNHGYQARMKGGVDGDRIKKDPRFQRTRENMYEFGRAVRTGKKLRQQLTQVLFSFTDKSMANRLTSLLHRIQKADGVNARGERVLLPENAKMLRGFAFNKGVLLDSIFNDDLVPSYDEISEQATLVIPAFNPLTALTTVPGATHVQFVLAAAELDLESDFPAKAEMVHSDYIPVVGLYEGDVLDVPVAPVNANNAVYMLVGIALFQEVNGRYYSLNSGEFNALTVAAVAAVAA